MSDYRLIAFDMDGTLLNSAKQVDGETVRAMERAAAAGKNIAINTGRALAEVLPYIDTLPQVRYAVCVSGALIYDCWEKRAVFTAPLGETLTKQLLDAAAREDVFLQMMTPELDIIPRRVLERLQDFKVSVYRELFLKVATFVDDVAQYYCDNLPDVLKLNLYHIGVEARDRTRERLKYVESEHVDSECTSLECTAKGITKASGQLALCRHLGISPAESIAVGDWDNDVSMLKAAGLPIAMGNANAAAMAASRVIVADCDHSGCAEAIYKYLL